MSQLLDVPVGQEWTPEALEALPAVHKYEVREGNLVVMNAAMRLFHSRTQTRITVLLGDLAYAETGIDLGPRELRTCDVGVFHEQPSEDQAYWPPEAFRLVVEIISPSTEREDRNVKPLLYAEAGIPEFWMVEETEHGEALVHRYELRDGVYEPIGEPVLLAELELE